MNLSELWRLYETDKRIQGFSPRTLKAYALQHKMLVNELGNLDIAEVTLTMLKEYLAKQADRLNLAVWVIEFDLFVLFSVTRMKRRICLQILL